MHADIELSQRAQAGGSAGLRAVIHHASIIDRARISAASRNAAPGMCQRSLAIE